MPDERLRVPTAGALRRRWAHHPVHPGWVLTSRAPHPSVLGMLLLVVVVVLLLLVLVLLVLLLLLYLLPPTMPSTSTLLPKASEQLLRPAAAWEAAPVVALL